MSNVLMIVQNDFVNDSRIIKEANTLGKAGFKVKVLALHNTGLREDEDFQYFSVKRLKLNTRNKLGKSKFSQIFKFIEFKKRCIEEAIIFCPDVIHCHDVYTLPIGNSILNKINRKIKFVYDSHELWKHASNNISMPKILIDMQNRLERKIIKKCDIVITVSESIVNYLEKEYSLKDNVILLRNIPNKHEKIGNNKIFHDEFNIDKQKKIVLYQGVVGSGRGIEKLIESIKYIQDDNIVLVILGNGSKVDKYKNLAKNLQVSNRVYFHSAVDPSILIKYTSSADLGVSIILNTCLSYYYSLPNKMFEYIQAEIPVLCSNYPDMERIVSTYNVGETANPDNIKEISVAIERILSDEKIYIKYKNNCVKAKIELNWEEESKKLVCMYKNLT